MKALAQETLDRHGGNGRWHSCRSFFFPLAMRTGPIPLKFKQVAGKLSKRSRSGAEGPSNNRGGQCRAGSGQIVKEETIGMRAEKFSNPPFVLSDERQKTLELLGQQFNSQGRWV